MAEMPVDRRFQRIKAEMLCPGGLQLLLIKYFRLNSYDFLFFAHLVNNLHHRTESNEFISPFINSFLTHQRRKLVDIAIV